MIITPLDIHHKEFKRAIRGYNEEDVDVFLDEVAENFELLYKENTDLKEQLENIDAKIKQYENIEETLKNTLFTAQKSAEEVQSNAKKEAELIIRDAELKSKEIIQGALNEKTKIQATINALRQAEEEFRMRFKSLLDSYLSVLNETGGIEEIEAKVEKLIGAKEEGPVEESSELATEEFIEEGEETAGQLSDEAIVISEEPEEVSEAFAKEAQEEVEMETNSPDETEMNKNKKGSKDRKKKQDMEIPSFLKEGPREDYLKDKSDEIEEIS